MDQVDEELQIVETTGLPVPVRRINKQSNAIQAQKYTNDQESLMLAQIALMLFKKKSQSEMCRELDVGQRTLTRSIKKLELLWRAEALKTFDDHRGRELAEINQLQRMYEEAYEQSKVRRRRSSIKSDFVKDKDEHKLKPQTQLVTQEDQPEGDPRFLDGIFKCIDRRIKLLGLDEPERFEIGAGVGNEKGRTALGDRKAKALALFGVVVRVGDDGGSPESGDDSGYGSGQSLDSSDSYTETSGVLVS